MSGDPAEQPDEETTPVALPTQRLETHTLLEEDGGWCGDCGTEQQRRVYTVEVPGFIPLCVGDATVCDCDDETPDA